MRKTYLLIVLFLTLTLPSCAVHVMSGNYLREVNSSVDLIAVTQDIEAHKGVTVFWGGIILEVKNLEDGSYVEVFETRLGRDGVPMGRDSKGRFYIYSVGLLDENLFEKGKKISVIGKVKELKEGKIGDMDYSYPVLDPIETKLVREVEVYEERYLHVYPYWYIDPFYNPWWPHRPPHRWYPYW